MSDEILQQALAGLPAPPLPEALAERVGRLVQAHLAPPEPAPAVPVLRLREALVPALLMSAAVVRTADTVQVAQEVFTSPGESGGSRKPPER